MTTRSVFGILACLSCALGARAVGAEVVLFSSDTAWPPTIIVNARVNQPCVFRVNVSGGLKCADQNDPEMSSGPVNSPVLLTGNSTNPVTRIQCPGSSIPDIKPPTFVQLDSSTKTIGTWLNPTSLASSGMLNAIPAFEFPYATVITPWNSATSYMKLSWKQKLPSFDAVYPWPKSVMPYLGAIVVVDHPTIVGKGLWYGISVFDPRPCVDKFVAMDAGTQMPMIAGCLGSTAQNAFFEAVPGSAGYTSTTSTSEQTYVMKSTRENLRAALTHYNERAKPEGWDLWPTDNASLAKMRLKGWVIQPELRDEDPCRYNRLRVYLAHSFSTSIPMDVWFKRSDLSDWQWGKQVQIPAGWSGWGPIDIDMSDVPHFAGRITKFALNPRRPSGPLGLFGFDKMQLGCVDPATQAFVSGAQWEMTNLPNPMTYSPVTLTYAFTLEGSHFEIFDFTDLWTNGSVWLGYLESSATFQWTVPYTPVDPTPMLGSSFRDIQFSVGD